MMSTVSNMPKVNVYLVGIDTRKSAIFSMAFKMHTAVQYELIDDAALADVIVVDVDGVEGQALWQLTLEKYPNTPRVYSSIMEPEFDSAYLPKPVKIEILFPVLRAALSGLVTYKVEEAKLKSSGRERLSFKDQAKNYKTTLVDEPETTSVPRDVRFPSEQVQHFDAKAGLLGALSVVATRSENIALVVDNKPVLMFFADINRVLLAVAPDKLESLCQIPNLVVESKVIGEHPEWKKHAKAHMDSCLWQFTIWTAQGRLPQEVNISQPIQLRSWPNITRLAYIPDAMRLSAFLTKSPVVLPMVYKMIRVDIKDLLNFVSACYTTKLLEVSRSAVAHTSNVTQSTPTAATVNSDTGSTAHETAPSMPTRPKQSSSMLQRLLKKLTGK